MPPRAENISTVFENARQDYIGAKTGTRFVRRRTGLAAQGSGANYHYRTESDYLRLMEYARDMDRNDPIIGQMIDRACDNILGDGLEPDPGSGVDAFDEMTKQKWWDWALDPDQCDIQQEDDFSQLSWMALRHHFVEGDHFGVGTDTGDESDTGAIQTWEAHRARTPSNTTKNCVHGIVVDGLGRRQALWVTKEDLDPRRALQRVGDVNQYAWRNSDRIRTIFQVRSNKRRTQTRGVTALAPVIIAAAQFEDIQFAKLVQQQVTSCITFLEKRALKSFENSEQTLEQIREAQRRTESFAPGMTRTVNVTDGEDIQGFSPNVPNDNYFEHMRMTLQLISINFGLPLNVTLLDPSDTNFSGWRGAIDQARAGFRRNQRMMVRTWYQPIYQWKVWSWIQKDPVYAALAAQVENPSDLYYCKWKLPRWPYIEPKKDAEARKIRRSDLQTSPRRLCGEDGTDFDEIAREIPEDNAQLISYAIQQAQLLNSQYKLAGTPQEIHWRDLLFLTDNTQSDTPPPPEQTNRRNEDDGDDA